MKYISVTQLRWNKEHTAIECVVHFERLGPVPFAAAQNDDYAHGREIYARCISGEFGPIADYIPAADEGPQEPNIPEGVAISVSTPGAIL